MKMSPLTSGNGDGDHGEDAGAVETIRQLAHHHLGGQAGEHRDGHDPGELAERQADAVQTTGVMA
jgi:hypothetical protein